MFYELSISLLCITRYFVEVAHKMLSRHSLTELSLLAKLYRVLVKFHLFL